MQHQAELAERQGDYAGASELKFGKIPQMQQEIEDARERLHELQGEDGGVLREIVGEDDIALVVSRWTGVPVQAQAGRAGEAAPDGVQPAQARRRTRRHRRRPDAVGARAGLQDPNRPIGSFIFLGPTGVGRPSCARPWPSSCR